MTTTALPSLVSTGWLAQHLADPQLRVIDATWFLNQEKRDAAAEFAAAHIPGAVRFDIDDIADRTTALPHMLPDAAAFARAVGGLGIGSEDRVIVYDRNANYAAARVWWTFHVFGHAHVAVLDGGLLKWQAEGRGVESGTPAPEPRIFSAADPDPELVRNVDEVRALVTHAAAPEQIIDARSAGRFKGVDPEPRPGLRMGHIPGAINVPYGTLLDPNAKTLLPRAALRPLFRAAGVDLKQPSVCYCGSGVTAALVALALHQIGASHVAVYDGSWAEWGARDDLPIER